MLYAGKAEMKGANGKERKERQNDKSSKNLRNQTSDKSQVEIKENDGQRRKRREKTEEINRNETSPGKAFIRNHLQMTRQPPPPNTQHHVHTHGS